MNKEEKFQKAMKALNKARQMQRDRLRLGLNFVDLYVEDVEGDWLSTWGEENSSSLSRKRFNATEWVQNLLTQGWQAVDSLLNQSQLNLGYSLRSSENPKERNKAAAAKLINLGLELENKSVVLLIAIIPKLEDDVNVYLELYPSGENKYLPPNLTLILLDEYLQTS